MYAIDEGMFEFALQVQQAIKAGWVFTDIKYGEERLGIGPQLVCVRNEKVVVLNSYVDIYKLLER